jgi:hypothetical protein
MSVPRNLTAAYCYNRSARTLEQAEKGPDAPYAASLTAAANGWLALGNQLHWNEREAAAIDRAQQPQQPLPATPCLPACRCFSPGEPLVDMDALAAHVAGRQAAEVQSSPA